MSNKSVITKTGDVGTTSTLNGKRKFKGDESFDVIGELDQLNCYIGDILLDVNNVNNMIVLMVAVSDTNKESIEFLSLLQNYIFKIGSFLSSDGKGEYFPTELFTTVITTVENLVYAIEKKLPPLSNFILPGGSSLATKSHYARTQTRKIERLMYKNLMDHTNMGPTDTPVIPERYKQLFVLVNRLSDYFFCMARLFNNMLGIPDVTVLKTPTLESTKV